MEVANATTSQVITAPHLAAVRNVNASPLRLVEYLGCVNYATSERVLGSIKALMNESSDPLTLLVTSTGGPTGTAMSFYDTVRYILKPNLITIGSGDVDSSGVLIYLSGDTRYVTPHTTLLLHPAGRVFDGHQRYTATEIEAMVTEDRLKDAQYAAVVAEHSQGRLTPEEVLSIMNAHTVLTPTDLIRMGLADRILDT